MTLDQQDVYTVDGKQVILSAYRSADDFTHKVTAVYGNGQSFQRAKTFKGETAWSDAQRYYDDIATEIVYRRSGF